LFTGVLCSRFEALDFKESAEFALYSVKMLSAAGGAPWPPDQGLYPWTPLGLLPKTPIIGSRSRARHILSVPVPFLLRNEHWSHSATVTQRTHKDACMHANIRLGICTNTFKRCTYAKANKSTNKFQTKMDSYGTLTGYISDGLIKL